MRAYVYSTMNCNICAFERENVPIKKRVRKYTIKSSLVGVNNSGSRNFSQDVP